MIERRRFLALLLLAAVVPALDKQGFAKDSDSGKNDNGGDGKGRGDDDDDRDEDRDDDRDDDSGGRKAARDAVRNGNAASLRDILKLVRRQYSGDIVDVRLRRGSSTLTYRIRLLSKDGKVLTITVDAQSRRIVKVTGQ